MNADHTSRAIALKQKRHLALKTGEILFFRWSKKKWIKKSIEELTIAYKDRLCRIGYEIIENLLIENSNTRIIIENDEIKSPEEELTNDLIEIITVFSSKLYGIRSYKSKSDL